MLTGGPAWTLIWTRDCRPDVDINIYAYDLPQTGLELLGDDCASKRK